MHRFLKRSRVEHQQEVSSVSGAKRDGNRPTGLYWRRLWGWEPTCSALHQPSGDSLSALHETRRENRWGWAKSVLVTRLSSIGGVPAHLTGQICRRISSLREPR